MTFTEKATVLTLRIYLFLRATYWLFLLSAFSIKDKEIMNFLIVNFKIAHFKVIQDLITIKRYIHLVQDTFSNILSPLKTNTDDEILLFIMIC